MSSLPKIYEHFVDTMIYGKQTLTMTKVNVALNSKELQKRIELKEEGAGEGLSVRDRLEKNENKNSRGESRSKSRTIKKVFHLSQRRSFQEKIF